MKLLGKIITYTALQCGQKWCMLVFNNLDCTYVIWKETASSKVFMA